MRRFLAAAILLAFAGPAFAHQCPALVRQIDQKLATAQLSAADKAKVAKLRSQGQAQHAAGAHDESEASLKAALALLK